VAFLSEGLCDRFEMGEVAIEVDRWIAARELVGVDRGALDAVSPEIVVYLRQRLALPGARSARQQQDERTLGDHYRSTAPTREAAGDFDRVAT
jgi:thymidylate kinase